MFIHNGLALARPEDALSKLVFHNGMITDGLVNTVLPLIKPGDHVMDAGAALGDHAYNYLNAVGPEGRVIAIEPNPAFSECLRYNCPSAVCIEAALWSEPRQVWLSGSYANMGAGMAIGKARTDDFSHGPIPAITIDSLALKRLDFVKLDIEGAEYFALLGARQTLARCRPKMLIEVNDGCMDALGVSVDQFYNLLDELGYDHKSVRNNPGPRGRFCDILCTPYGS